tara:strand:- start:1981 stop:2151 length:171 start_codon:yes stop_codon:yes gene_type:complete
MMRDRTKRIGILKIEIEDLEKDIEKAIRLGKDAYAVRLKLIKEKKVKILNSWILNS